MYKGMIVWNGVSVGGISVCIPVLARSIIIGSVRDVLGYV